MKLWSSLLGFFRNVFASVQVQWTYLRSPKNRRALIQRTRVTIQYFFQEKKWKTWPGLLQSWVKNLWDRIRQIDKDEIKAQAQKLKAKGEETFSKENLQKAKETLQSTAGDLKAKTEEALSKENLQKAKESLQNTAEEFKSKTEEALSKENLQKAKETLQNTTEDLKIKAQELETKASPLSEKLKEASHQASTGIGAQTAKIRARLQHAHDDTSPSRSRKGLESILLVVAAWPGFRWLIDKWMNLRIWKSDKAFFQILLPTLGLSSLLLLSAGLGLYFYIKSNLNQTEDDIRIEATESLKAEIYEKYGTYIHERSHDIQQTVLENITKANLLADAPTFQELNIQNMEKFSRSLLRKDTNLLNVVILTDPKTKKSIRTRRIGDTTRFIFTCCELPGEREVTYQEIQEEMWLAAIGRQEAEISDIYVNPTNGEKYFYHGANIKNIKGEQAGAVLLRYNLNFAISGLKNGLQTGQNFLIANDSLLVATSQDTLMPQIEVAAYEDRANKGPTDYVIAVINIIRKASNQAEAIQQLREGAYIKDPVRFQRQFGQILPYEIPRQAKQDSMGNVYWLDQAQAEAILNLSFGQLLGLNQSSIQQAGGSHRLSLAESKILVEAYLDSIRKVGSGIIVDADYLLSFETNDFGWILINQSTSEQYLAPVLAKNDFIIDRFDRITSRIFWFVLLAGLFFLVVFLLMTTGILYRFTDPLRHLVQKVYSSTHLQDTPSQALEGMDELVYLRTAFMQMDKSLTDYISQLKDSNQQLEMYAQTIAHDLKAPLRILHSYASILEDRYQEVLGPEGQEYLQEIMKASQRMNRMIGIMLDYASLSQKMSDAVQQDVNFHDLVTQATLQLKESYGPIEMEVTIGNLPTLSSHPTFMEILFQNVLDNSVKYRQVSQPLHIEVTAQEREDYWQFIIQDNGIGIEPGQSEKIFDMFYRGGEHEGENGFGIGLATSRRIIHHQGGDMWVESEGLGKGSRFCFTLPKSVSIASTPKETPKEEA
ncbi:MAG: ATP-binding protein [Bacteroidota bacterium]